jgi:hypothetical protein
VVPRIVLPTVDRWEHKGTYATEASAAGGGIVGDGSTVVVEDNVVVLLVVCRLGGTSVDL